MDHSHLLPYCETDWQREAIQALIDEGSIRKAAVIHDWLYTSKITTRRVADAVLREAGKVSGVPAWRRWMIWAGVRAFGHLRW